MVFISMRAAPPSRRHLRHWETVCRFLEAQPYRAVSLPFPTDPPMSVRLFKRMAAFRLVRHRDDCRWQLSPHWRAILQRLWDRVPLTNRVLQPVDLNCPIASRSSPIPASTRST